MSWGVWDKMKKNHIKDVIDKSFKKNSEIIDNCCKKYEPKCFDLPKPGEFKRKEPEEIAFMKSFDKRNEIKYYDDDSDGYPY